MPANGMIGKTIDHYRIDQLLGQGGMAAVYRATDEQLERPVAIKVMHPHLAAQKSFQNRFLQEARTAANLDHPNIVRILDFKPYQNELFLVMEYITGGSLRQYIKRLHEESRFIDYPEAIEIARQLANALEFAHRRGMIHRDIKPDNVLLKPEQDSGRLNYRPILTDFGLAKLTSASEDAITDQQPIGTYPYMSPEQCLGDDIDSRSDIYSLGIMLYELSVGRLPYNPKTIAEAARMHGREPLPPPSSFQANFPAELEQIIIKSLSKRAEDRFQTAAELERALQALQKPLQPPAQIRALPPRPTQELPAVNDEIVTDLTTAVMETPLPARPDFDVSPLQTDEAFDHLIFHSPNHEPFAAKLQKERTIIGRDREQADVHLESAVVSRAHVVVERKPNGRYTIAALKTANPILLDGAPLSENAPVIFNPGATACVGDYWMRLELKPILPEAVEEKLQDPDDIDLPAVPLDVPSFLDVDVLDDAPPTRPLDAATAREMPYYTPPHLTADQLGYDRLVFFSENAPTVIVKLDRSRVLVGRSQLDVVLPDASVSRRHARVEKFGEQYHITDLGSANGTWIDDKRLPPQAPAPLKPEQNIRLGNYWMRYELKRDLPPELRPVVSTAGARLEVTDPNETAPMLKPLPMELPAYSPPPLPPDMRTRDRLIFLSEDHPMQIIKFEGDILYVGRDSELDVVLEGKRVSRRHAMIERRNNRLYVTDLNSTNGTWVGDTLLVPDTEVPWRPEDNENLRIGNYWVKFERADIEQYAAVVLQDSYGRVGKRIKNFRIDRFLGEGNISAVYKATEFPLERAVALRIMHPNLAAQEPLKQRFLQEARRLSQLNHENIARVFSFDNVDNELFMVMDLITGPSLRAYLNRQRDLGKPLNLRDILVTCVEIADALHYAHQQGMMYRDMRPESIILKPVTIGSVVTHKPMLTEFAVARLSESGEIFATERPETSFPYMSPEQCLGERVDIRSDVYELGVILYEMLVGRPPYQPRSMSEAIRMHSREPLPPPSNFRSDIPEDLEKVVLKALEKRANDRYQTCAELSLALQRTTAAASAEGISTGRFGSIVVDEQATAIMERPLPDEMPPPTRAPRPGEQREHDQLVLYSERFPTRVIVLDRDVYTIGRENDQDIVLPGDNVSRRHARLERAPGDVYRLIDFGSKNGTWLGGYRLIKNVAETWEKSETARIGDFWLRIETPSDHEAPVFEAAVENGGAARPEVALPPPVTPMETEKIGVTVSSPTLRVVPGQTTTLSVEVANRSDLVDHFKVEAIGLPPEWVTQPAQPLYLLPHNRDSTSLTFHPPLTSTSSAGGHAFEIRVTARAMGITSPGVQGALNVEPFYAYTTELAPGRIKRRGATELRISNTGNSFMTFMLQARDREQGLIFDVAGQQYTLAPGQTDYVSIRVRPKRRPFLGQAVTYPFEVKTTPVPPEQAGGPQTQTGELIAPARFSVIGLGCLALLLLLCGVLVGGAAYLTGIHFPAQTQTVTAIAMATGVPATATAVAGIDTDGDGLTDLQEIELKTRPDVADTDQDGLTDGEEVYIWKTDPLNRDTDGDNIPDGTEVARGTNPTNPDTDGDGIPDNVDPDPLGRSTPTVTPFPTIEGSAGDICPGSPSPTRMKIGMTAIVTPGGVNNRLRDKPSVKDGKVIDLMPPTSEFTVVGGPVCDEDDQIRWWQVTYKGLTGWTAEGEGTEYYLGPPGSEGSGSASGGGTSSISSPPKLAASVNPDLVGVQLDINAGGQVMSLVEPLDVHWVKIQANWSALEPGGRGQPGGDFSRFLAAVGDAKNRGYKVLVSVAKAPAWARAANLGEDSPPDNPQDLADFIGRMLQQTNVDAIEIWNEPNLRREWNGALPFSGAGYMMLFEPVYRQIRAISPDVKIITAGLAPTGNGPDSINDRTYLRQMYDAGLAQYRDVAVGIHPYGWGNAPDARCCNPGIEGQGWADQPQFYFLDTIADYRSVMLAAGHNVDLWATEFGWATWEGFPGQAPEGYMTYNTPDRQAEYTLAAFKIAQALDFMGPMFLWNLNFANPTTVNGGSDMAGYSLVYVDGGHTVVRRPLYDVMASLRQ